MYLKTQGLVLREVAYKDTDKLLTVLTRDYGKMTLKARGVRRSASCWPVENLPFLNTGA